MGTKVRADEEKMKIAWRYQQQQQSSVNLKSSFSHNFNLGKTMNIDHLSHKTTWSIPIHDDDEDSKNCYRKLLKDVKSECEKNEIFSPVNPGPKSVLRVCIQDLGSPVWTPDEDHRRRSEVTGFLLALRSVVRGSLMTCFVSLANLSMFGSSDEVMNEDIKRSVRECCDFVLCLKPFDDKLKKRGGIFKDNHGFIDVKKALGFNALKSVMTANERFVFRSARSKFSIERIHLPPMDVEDTQSGDKLSKKNVDF